MKVQIRPAIYGDKGIRYEAYKVTAKFSWWKGTKTTYDQLYFIPSTNGEYIPTDYLGWKFNEDAIRSTNKVKEMVEILKSVYGTHVKFCRWAPEV